MKNWPRYKKWRKQERQRQHSEYLLAFAEHLPDWNIRLLKSLKGIAKYRREPDNLMAVHCPLGLTVSPSFLTYFDLYFTEDFNSLENGLIALLTSGVTSEPFMQSPQDNIPELFQHWRTNLDGGSWHNIGYLTFKQSSWHPETFDALLVELIQISATCVNLVVSAFPSNSFVARFHKLISSEVKHTIILNKFGIFPRRWVSANLLPSHIRQNELEELFLGLNREVVLLLREYIGRGWSATGPLPSVQCFTFTHEPDIDPNERSLFEFWRSLSLPRTPSIINYSNGTGVDVIPPHWLDNGTFTMPYRILVNSNEYLTTSRIKNYGSSKMALFANIGHEFVRPLVPLLALREHCHRTVEAASAYRDRLSPTITTKKGLLATARLITQLMHVPPRLNSLRFSLSRITESSVKRFLDYSKSTSFRRETRRDTDDGLLSTDLRREIDFLGKHASEQLEILRNAYYDLWNFCIQWILIILTIIGVIIAIAQFLPNRQNLKKPVRTETTSVKQSPQNDLVVLPKTPTE